MRLCTQSVLRGSLVFALWGCDANENDDSAEVEAAVVPVAKPDVASAPAEAETPATRRAEISGAAPPVITVQRPGAAPKEPLRFSPEVGSTESVRMTMTMTTKAGGQRLAAPPIVADTKLRIDQVGEESIKATYTVVAMTVGENAKADAALVSTLKTMLGDLQSFEAHLETDRRGVLLGGYVDVPQSLPAQLQTIVEQMQQSMAQTQTPLPEDAVGVGAKWTAVGTIVQGGMELEQTAKYQLVERKGSRLKVKVKVVQKLVSPNFAPPGMPGVKAKITMFQSAGTGTVLLSTDHLSPTSLALAIKLKMAMQITVLGEQQSQDLQLDMGLQLERRRPGTPF